MSLTGAENSSDTNCCQAAAFFAERSRRAGCVTKLPLEAGARARHALPHLTSLYSDFFGYLAHVHTGLPRQWQASE